MDGDESPGALLIAEWASYQQSGYVVYAQSPYGPIRVDQDGVLRQSLELVQADNWSALTHTCNNRILYIQHT